MSDDPIAAMTVVALNGEFDLVQQQKVKDAFAAAAPDALVVVDLERTRFIDSTVLACLMRLRKDLAESGGRLILTSLPPTVRRLLDVARLLPLFDVRTSVAEVQSECGLEAGALRRIEVVAETLP